MNMRGLSDVVATVLTILMVIIAVAIVWNFSQPVLNKIGILNTVQYNAKLSVPEDSITLDTARKQISFDIKREQGQGNISAFIFGLKDQDGNTRIFTQNASINELELKRFTIDYSQYPITDVLSISVTPIYTDNKTGTEQNGKPITQKVPPQ